MPRRNPGTESATGVRVARERLAATRWAARGAEDAADPGESPDPGREPGDSAGLLELQVPAPGSPVPVRAADAVLAAGRRVGGGTSHHADETRGYRRAGRQTLALRFRARTGVKAAALLGVLAVVLGGCFWWQAGTGGAQVVALSDSAPAAEEAPDPADGGSTAPPGDDATAEPESIEVHVAGAVASPGVVQLPAGSRLHEAIAAAGGPTVLGDPDRLNLAAVLEDGQKVLVPIRGEPGQAGCAHGRLTCARFRYGRHGASRRWREGQPQHRRPRGTRDPPARRAGAGAADRGLAPAARAVQDSAGARRRRRDRSEVA